MLGGHSGPFWVGRCRFMRKNMGKMGNMPSAYDVLESAKTTGMNGRPMKTFVFTGPPAFLTPSKRIASVVPIMTNMLASPWI